jgi:hypothetical protein
MKIDYWGHGLFLGKIAQIDISRAPAVPNLRQKRGVGDRTILPTAIQQSSVKVFSLISPD